MAFSICLLAVRPVLTIGAVKGQDSADSRREFKAEGAFQLFQDMAKSRYRSELLEPAGSVTLLLKKPEAYRFTAVVSSLDKSERGRLADLLASTEDPIASRMAVTLAVQAENPKAGELLQQALGKFPQDPELLLAAAIFPGKPFDRPPDAFGRALLSLSSLSPGGEEGKWFWCGMEAASADCPLHGVEEYAGLVSFLSRVQPPAIPDSWLGPVFFSTMGTAAGSLEEMSQRIGIIRRYLKFPAAHVWPIYHCLLALREKGGTSLAGTTAEWLLAQPFGALSPPPMLWVDGGSNAAPWIPDFNRSSPVALRIAVLASAADKEGFARRAVEAFFITPTDEHLALTALVAISLVRILEEGDLEVLSGFPVEGRNRIIIKAGVCLNRNQIPSSLSAPAWEAKAMELLHGRTSGWEMDMILTCLDYLDEGGSREAAHRVISVMRNISFVGITNEGPHLVRFLKKYSSPEEWARWCSKLAAEWGTQPSSGLPTDDYISLSADILRAFADEYTREKLPDVIGQKVSKLLSEFAKDIPAVRFPQAAPGMFQLCCEAAAYPEFGEAVIKVISKYEQQLCNWESDCGKMLLQDFAALTKQGRMIPEVKVEVLATQQGSHALKFLFQGIQIPEDLRRPESSAFLPLPAVAFSLGGQFDVRVSAISYKGGAPVPISTLHAIRHDEVRGVAGLPAAGWIQVGIFRTGTVQQIAQTDQMPYTSSKPLEEADWPVAVRESVDPFCWKLLTIPVKYEGAGSWLVSTGRGLLPPDLSLLLLTDEGGVWGYADMGRKSSDVNSAQKDFVPRLVSSEDIMPHKRPPSASGADRVRKISGKWRMALAVPRGKRAGASPLPASSQLRLQKWPSIKPGRLEIVHLWQMEKSGASYFDSAGQVAWPNVRIGGHPIHAAWLLPTQKGSSPLSVLTAALDPEYNESLLEFRLPKDYGQVYQSEWQGTRFHLKTLKVPRDNLPRPNEHGLIYMNTAAPAEEPALELLTREFQLVRNPSGEGGEHGMLVVYQIPFGIDVLMPDGKRLVLDSKSSEELHGCLQHSWITPTRFACYVSGTDGKGPGKILDWTSGILNAETVPKLPPPVFFPSSWPKILYCYNPDDEDLMAPEFKQWRGKWQSPVHLDEIWLTKNDLVVGRSGADVLLMRQVKGDGTPPGN